MDWITWITTLGLTIGFMLVIFAIKIESRLTQIAEELKSIRLIQNGAK